ncbi:MAG: hypothetical protein MET45_27455 [Nostoc sp. LLA-1]|nr:hypothetical protein [Cyanocohniella sp. LLY]
MKIKIQETAISDFLFFEENLPLKTRLFSNLVALNASIPELIYQFQRRSQASPIKKPFIKVNIKFINVIPLTVLEYQQILTEYLTQIGWDDLQYIGFISDLEQPNVEVDIIFNRVISRRKVISLQCLGANWKQYQILRESFQNLLKLGCRV